MSPRRRSRSALDASAIFAFRSRRSLALSDRFSPLRESSSSTALVFRHRLADQIVHETRRLFTAVATAPTPQQHLRTSSEKPSSYNTPLFEKALSFL
jgi:hypothetical protein